MSAKLALNADKQRKSHTIQTWLYSSTKLQQHAGHLINFVGTVSKYDFKKHCWPSISANEKPTKLFVNLDMLYLIKKMNTVWISNKITWSQPPWLTEDESGKPAYILLHARLYSQKTSEFRVWISRERVLGCVCFGIKCFLENIFFPFIYGAAGKY